MTAITIKQDTPKGGTVTGGEGRRRVTFTAPYDLLGKSLIFYSERELNNGQAHD